MKEMAIVNFLCFFSILFVCAVVAENIPPNAAPSELVEGNGNGEVPQAGDDEPVVVVKMEVSKEEAYEPPPEILPQKDMQDTVIMDVKQEVNDEPPAETAHHTIVDSTTLTDAGDDSVDSSIKRDEAEAKDKIPPVQDSSTADISQQQDAKDSGDSYGNAADEIVQEDKPMSDADTSLHILQVEEPTAEVKHDASEHTMEAPETARDSPEIEEALPSDDDPNTDSAPHNDEPAQDVEKAVESEHHNHAPTEVVEEPVVQHESPVPDTFDQPEVHKDDVAPDTPQNIVQKEQGSSDPISTEEKVDATQQPDIPADDYVHAHTQSEEIIDHTIAIQIEKDVPDTMNLPESNEEPLVHQGTTAHDETPVEPEVIKSDAQQTEQQQVEPVVKAEETVEQIYDPLPDEEETVKPTEPSVVVTEPVEEFVQPIDTPTEEMEEFVQPVDSPIEPMEEFVQPVDTPTEPDEETVKQTEESAAEKEPGVSTGSDEAATEEASSEPEDDNGGYKSGSICSYCKYCKLCALCRKCPCKEDKNEEHCAMCKYCKYCYLCDYICVSVCNPGGFLDTFSGFVYSALPNFSKQTKDEADKDIDKSRDFIKEYL